MAYDIILGDFEPVIFRPSEGFITITPAAYELLRVHEKPRNRARNRWLKYAC